MTDNTIPAGIDPSERLTPQRAYELVRAYAATMKAPAVNSAGKCLYRSPNGPCLVGYLIDDMTAAYGDGVSDDTAPDTTKSIHSLYSDFRVPHLVDALAFLASAQNAHDILSEQRLRGVFAERLVRRLDQIAVSHGLKVPGQ